MIIQSKRVYIASTFTPAQVEIKDDKIVAIYPYGTKKANKDSKRYIGDKISKFIRI